MPFIESNLVKEDKLENESNMEENIECWRHLVALFFNSSKSFNIENSQNEIDVNLPIIIVS